MAPATLSEAKSSRATSGILSARISRRLHRALVRRLPGLGFLHPDVRLNLEVGRIVEGADLDHRDVGIAAGLGKDRRAALGAETAPHLPAALGRGPVGAR